MLSVHAYVPPQVRERPLHFTIREAQTLGCTERYEGAVLQQGGGAGPVPLPLQITSLHQSPISWADNS